jgi:hypothetical protein
VVALKRQIQEDYKIPARLGWKKKKKDIFEDCWGELRMHA